MTQTYRICGQKAIKKKYLLRCCFDYVSRPTWKSQWNNTDGGECNKAWFNNKSGVVNAYVEGKDVITKEIIRMIEVTGDKFCNFEWVALTVAPLQGSITIAGENVGLTIVTPDHRVTVFCDGALDIKDRDDKDFNFATYGK